MSRSKQPSRLLYLRSVGYSFCLVIALSFGVGVHPLRATANGLTFAPGFLVMNVPSGQAIEDAAISVKNETDADVKLSAQPVDVDINSPDLTPLKTQNAELTKALTIRNPNLVLRPGQAANILVRADASSLSGGGHYAAITIRRDSPTSGASVPIQQAVAVTVFLTKEEGAVRSLAVQTPLPKGIVFRPPALTSVEVRNTGNTLVTPRLALQIKQGDDVLRKQTSESTEKSLVSTQSRRIQLQTVFQKKYAPGKYKVVLEYRYDGQETTDVISTTIWYIPIWVLALALPCIGLIVFFVVKKLKISSKKTAKSDQKA